MASLSGTGVRVQPRRRIRQVVALLLVLGIVLIGYFIRDTTPDLGWVQSGKFRLLQINADSSLRISPLNSKDLSRNVSASDRADVLQTDVHWLGVELLDMDRTAAWVRTRLTNVDEITIRLDRRRLNEEGDLEAYFFLHDQLLNAELVEQGLAIESTHPSDFAAIARQIRRAQLQP